MFYRLVSGTCNQKRPARRGRELVLSQKMDGRCQEVTSCGTEKTNVTDVGVERDLPP